MRQINEFLQLLDDTLPVNWTQRVSTSWLLDDVRLTEAMRWLRSTPLTNSGPKVGEPRGELTESKEIGDGIVQPRGFFTHLNDRRAVFLVHCVGLLLCCCCC
jgi:hypothetical protein